MPALGLKQGQRKKALRLYFVTGNEHKLEEARSILAPYGIEVVRMPEKKLEVQSDCLEEIARIAAESVGRRDLLFFVEDAGLFIPALNGFPGPYSSYVYRTIGLRGLLKLMEDVTDRSAIFRSVVALNVPQVGIKTFVGEVYGTIASDIRGTHGFGFDPIFIPHGSSKTFAEMTLNEKNKVSHRAASLTKMAIWLINNNQTKFEKSTIT